MVQNDPSRPTAVLRQAEEYRARLIAAGFTQASPGPDPVTQERFYRQDTEWTAFAVNLRLMETGVTVVYGYASTAFTRMEGPDALKTWGCLEVTLCEAVHIPFGGDPAPAAARIQALHDAHRGVDRDGVLALAKEKRKAFIASIARRMKPLGFRKTRNNWALVRPDGVEVTLVLQKSMYADGYYFNLEMRPAEAAHFHRCVHTRILLDGEQCLPWQELGEDVLAAYLDGSLLPAVTHLITAPLTDLGRDPAIWAECACDRRQCETCWVAKNCWEANGRPEP